MNNVNALYETLGLNEARRIELAALGKLSNVGTPQAEAVVVETVVIMGGEREVTNREKVIAELVRTAGGNRETW